MALKKLHTTPSGVPLTIFRITPGRIDPDARDASFWIHGYAHEGIPKNKPSITPCFGKVRLEGDTFDLWLSKAALTAAADEGRDLYEQLYLFLRSPGLKNENFARYDYAAVPLNFFEDAEDLL